MVWVGFNEPNGILPHHLHALAIVQQGGALVELLEVAATVEDAAVESLYILAMILAMVLLPEPDSPPLPGRGPGAG